MHVVPGSRSQTLIPLLRRCPIRAGIRPLPNRLPTDREKESEPDRLVISGDLSSSSTADRLAASRTASYANSGTCQETVVQLRFCTEQEHQIWMTLCMAKAMHIMSSSDALPRHCTNNQYNNTSIRSRK